MRFLSIVNALVFDRTVGSPISHGRERVVYDLPGRLPIREHDGLQGLEPAQAASGHATTRFAQTQANGGEVRVAGKAHIDVLHGIPKLVKCRVQIEVEADW